MVTLTRTSESRTEAAVRELLMLRGWSTLHPPKGHLLWKNEYRDYPQLNEALLQASKSGPGYGLPDFIILSRQTQEPLIVGEAKANVSDIKLASDEASEIYGEVFVQRGIHVLAAGVAGDGDNAIAVRVNKRSLSGWRPIEYRDQPIEWLPTPDETDLLLHDDTLFHLDPRVPPPDVLAAKADEINRILRESRIKDEYRPAVIGAIMLALWKSRGAIRASPEYILSDINEACRRAFQDAQKFEIADSIVVPEANERLAANAGRISRILRLLNVTTLTAAHDYLGQLYETFFRFTGGNTIGQFFTPRHVTRFMADLCEINDSDCVIDPTCGTGGFLVSALYRMMDGRNLTREQVSRLVADHLSGFESEPITAALCVTNMILRGDGTTGIVKGDCFTDDRFPEAKATVVLSNPPFPHKNTDDPTQKFVDRFLEALQVRGDLAVIVPGSLLVKGGMVNKWREQKLESNSLRAVITLPGELFQPYASAITAILLLEKGIPHDETRPVFFAHIENDGYRLRKRVRVEQQGEQLSDVLAAYRNHRSIAGRCIWTPISRAEWSPSAYIESVPLGEDILEETASFLISSNMAFQVLHADELTGLRNAVDSGELEPKPYKRRSNSSINATPCGENTIGKLFKIYYGQPELESKLGLAQGVVPVISSAGSDNGCHGFYELPPNVDVIAPPFVTVPRTGSIGEAFVQLVPCGATSDCLLLIPQPDTDLEDLFIAAATIRHEKWRFNYGRKVTPNRITHLALNRTAELKSRINRRHQELLSAAGDLLSGYNGTGLRKEFERLIEDWEEQRPRGVDVSEMVMHPTYQRIIGVGPRVVPLLLAELQRKSGHWFWALHAITGANPVPEDSQGNLRAMAEAWLEWGRQRGYRW